MSMEITVSSCDDSVIDICSDSKLPDLEYADDIVYLSEDSDRLWVFLDRLNDSDTSFVPSTFKIL